MDDSERLSSLRLFIGALARVLGNVNEVPFDPTSFATAVDNAQRENNAFASRFAVYTTIAGRRCPDFLEGLTLAQSAGLISRQNPNYTSFVLRMPTRQIRRLEAEQEFTDAEDLARHYLQLVGPDTETRASA